MTLCDCYIASYIWWYKPLKCVVSLYNILRQVWWASYIQAQQPAASRQCSGVGGRVAGSAMNLPLIPCGGRTWCASQHLTEPATAGGPATACAWLDAQRAQQTGLPLGCSKHHQPELWRDGRQPLASAQIWGRCAQWYSSSRWDNLVRNCLCCCPNKQSQASLLLSWLTNDHAKKCNFVFMNISCKAFDYILQLSVVEKKSLPNLRVKWTKSLHSITINQNYKVYNSRLNLTFLLNLIYSLAMKQDQAAYAKQIKPISP